MISIGSDGVTITCDTAFAHIYYTDDFSEPSEENGTLYNAPIEYHEGDPIKAVAYVGNGIYSDIAELSGE